MNFLLPIMVMDFRVWEKLLVNSERKKEGSRRESPAPAQPEWP